MSRRTLRHGTITLVIAVALPGVVIAADSAKAKPTSAKIARGRYLATVGNCNDCHTRDFGPRNGDVPEREWLKGGTLGFSGPWGTTYASVPSPT